MMGVRDTRRTRQVLVVLLAVALALIAFGYADGSSPALRGVRHVSGAVFGGAEHAASSVAGFFGGSGGSSGQVRQLQAQVAQLRAELSRPSSASPTTRSCASCWRWPARAGTGSSRPA
jgi:hypothetical protein